VLPRPVVVSKLRRKRPLCAEEFTYLRARTNHPAKTTMISAQQAAAYYDGKKSASAYPKIDAYLADLVDILRDEVEELVRWGCTYIQIDSPQYAALLDPQLREGYRQRGNDPDRLLDISTEMDNAVIGNHPGVTFVGFNYRCRQGKWPTPYLLKPFARPGNKVHRPRPKCTC
jgi:5-methyltetrahydropteroyltriglutamate--homocysteine methyltransferase